MSSARITQSCGESDQCKLPEYHFRVRVVPLKPIFYHEPPQCGIHKITRMPSIGPGYVSTRISAYCRRQMIISPLSDGAGNHPFDRLALPNGGLCIVLSQISNRRNAEGD
jgi:hypothetical protein